MDEQNKEMKTTTTMKWFLHPRTQSEAGRFWSEPGGSESPGKPKPAAVAQDRSFPTHSCRGLRPEQRSETLPQSSHHEVLSA